MLQSKVIGKRDDVMRLRVTPDGKYAAVFKADSPYSFGYIYLHNLITGSLSHTVSMSNSRRNVSRVFDISPDGGFVAVITSEDTGIPDDAEVCHIWDTSRRELLSQFISNSMIYKSSFATGVDVTIGYGYTEVLFLPDSDSLITVTSAGEIFVWSISKQQLLWSFTAAAHFCWAVAFSHKVGLFVMAEETVQSRGGRIGKYRTRYGTIRQDNQMDEELYIGNLLRLWNIYSGEMIRELECDTRATNLVFNHQDNLIAGKIETQTWIWDVETGKSIRHLPQETTPIGFTADDVYLVVQLGNHSIGLWNMLAHDWHKVYRVEGSITSSQITATNTVISVVKTVDTWELHQLQLNSH